MREINFENTTPPQIKELESGLRRLGAHAHTGNSRTTYEENDCVEFGSLLSSAEEN